MALLTSTVPYLFYSRSVTPFSSWSFFNAYDEYSYLLAADTFASGRLTNPTHPMWRHFETRSVNHRPTYQSMYPPGQGAFLALGQALTGHPIVGVWMCMILACVATCSMLQAWFPPRWALFGGLLVALHARMALEWGGTYWGGGIAMLGGALVFGSLRRILDRGRVRDSLLFALGLAILANSRPFEGLVASLPALAALAGGLVLDRKSRRLRFTRVVAPLAAVLALSAAAMAYYNDRLTGSPWTLPYQVYLATHPEDAPFASQMVRGEPTSEHHGGDESFSGKLGSERSGPKVESKVDSRVDSPYPYRTWWTEWYTFLVSSPSSVVATSFKVLIQWSFYFGPVLTVALLALPFGPFDRWIGFALLTSGLTLLAVLTTSAALPHYLAPVAPLLFVLVVQGFRSLGAWRRHGRRIGRRWVRALAVVWVLQLILMVVAFPTVMQALRWGEPRQRVQARLERMDGQHLVIVRYGPAHVFYQEWVFNRADIDRAKVIWARELAPESDRELLAYFHDRHVWLVEPDRNPPRLVPYAAGMGSTPP